MSKQVFYTGSDPPMVVVKDGQFNDVHKKVLSAHEIDRMKCNPKQQVFFRRWSDKVEK